MPRPFYCVKCGYSALNTTFSPPRTGTEATRRGNRGTRYGLYCCCFGSLPTRRSLALMHCGGTRGSNRPCGCATPRSSGRTERSPTHSRPRPPRGDSRAPAGASPRRSIGRVIEVQPLSRKGALGREALGGTLGLALAAAAGGVRRVRFWRRWPVGGATGRGFKVPSPFTKREATPVAAAQTATAGLAVFRAPIAAR